MSVASERVRREWRNRVAAEYRSAALTAELLHWMIQAGLDDELHRTAIRIVGDELDHATLSHEAYLAFGGGDEPMPVELSTLSSPRAPEGLLVSLLDSITRNFCLGETLAVPLFAAIREGTTHPSARPALDRILRDESVHRAFGWAALDALMAIDADAVRQRVESQLPAWLAGFERAYADGREAPPLRPEERAAGLLDLVDYERIFHQTVDGTIRSRFADRGIALRRATGPVQGATFGS